MRPGGKLLRRNTLEHVRCVSGELGEVRWTFARTILSGWPQIRSECESQPGRRLFRFGFKSVGMQGLLGPGTMAKVSRLKCLRLQSDRHRFAGHRCKDRHETWTM